LSSFEELKRRCRRYRLKRKIPWLIAIVAMGMGGWYAYEWIMPTSAISSAHSSSIKSASSSRHVSIQSSSSSSSLPKRKKVAKRSQKGCYALRLLYVYDKFWDKIIAYRQKVQKLGFECSIERGRLLSSGDRQLFLVCDPRSSKKALAPSIALAKRHGLDFEVIRHPCVAKKKSVARPKASTKAKKQVKKDIIQAQSVTDVKRLQELFAKRKSYPLAIRIAKIYYQKGVYDKALEWAKIANKLQRDKEEAWILYAQSLYKLGKKEKAKKILRIFLEFRDSVQAKRLLQEWS